MPLCWSILNSLGLRIRLIADDIAGEIPAVGLQRQRYTPSKAKQVARLHAAGGAESSLARMWLPNIAVRYVTSLEHCNVKVPAPGQVLQMRTSTSSELSIGA